MAILGKIRNQGVILILVIALALFAFIIQGVLTSNGQKQADAVGYVGDTEINRESFARKVENISQNRGANFSQVQAVNSVWDQEVRNAVLNQEINAAGINVTDDKVAEKVKEIYKANPQFQNEDGTFSEAKFKTFVEGIKSSNPGAWNDYVMGTATSTKQDLFFNLLKSGLTATNTDGEMEYRMENDNRSFSFVNIPYTTIEDNTVEVTSSEINDYVSKHKDQFKVDAQRDIEFALFEDKASQADKDALKADLSKLLTSQTLRNLNSKEDYTVPAITEATDLNAFVSQHSQQAYNDRYTMVSNLPAAAKAIANLERGNTYGPYEDGEYMKLALVEDKKVINDSVQNRQILIAFNGNQTKEKTKATADSIFNTIGQNKSKFDSKFAYFEENKEVAISQDKGWVVFTGNARSNAPGYNKFIFANTSNTIGVAESVQGFHIIRIDDVAAPKDAIKLATVSKKIIASKQTGKELYTKTVKFQQTVKGGDFTALAKENAITTTPVKNLKPLDETLPTIGKNRSIVKWAFNEERTVGDIERFDTAQGYVVVKINKMSDAGNMSSEEASAKVTPILRKEKKAKMIMDKITANEINEIAKNQGQVSKSVTAVNRKNPTIQGAGEEPFVVGTAFGLAQGATSKPIAGENGVFIIKVTAIETAPDLPNYASNANTITTQAANQSSSKLVEALKKAIEIEDNRSVFY